MTTKHTPGPWETAGMTVYTPDKWANGNCTRGTCVAGAYCEGNRELFKEGFFPDEHPLPESDEEAFANARLIAAAPELLSACKAVFNSASNLTDGLSGMLSSVIHKAEGK